MSLCDLVSIINYTKNQFDSTNLILKGELKLKEKRFYRSKLIFYERIMLNSKEVVERRLEELESKF